MWEVGWSISMLLTASAICVCSHCCCFLEQNSSKGRALIWFLT
jgi:hypothetical protein